MLCSVVFYVIKSSPFKFLSLWKRNVHRAVTGNSSVVMVNMLPSGHSVFWQLLTDVSKPVIRNIHSQSDSYSPDALLPLLVNLALEYAIRNVQVNQDGLKLYGTHQILVYVDNVTMLGGGVLTIKENAEAVVMANKEIGPEVNADKTMYLVMCQEQNARRSHSLRLIIVPLKRWKNSNIWEQS